MDNVSKNVNRSASLRKLTDRLGLSLNRFELLDEALTHASYLAECAACGRRDYEALEFLGDAVLELAVSHFLFEHLPGQGPGDYTKLRASVVNRDCVGRVAQRIKIAPYILLGKGEEASGGRNRIALLADCLEAVIGAVYRDAGWPTARDFVLKIFSIELQNLVDAPPVSDYKSLLQQYCQAQHVDLPRFDVVRSDGPDHCKEFEVEVFVLKRFLGRGTGRTKKEAEQQAAQQALFEINHLV